MHKLYRTIFFEFLNLMKELSYEPVMKFAYQSKFNWMVTCIIARQDGDGISFEEICAELAGDFCSRSTIQTILDAGVAMKFYIKAPKKDDRRVQLYRITEKGEAHLEQWVNDHAEIFKAKVDDKY